MEMGAANELYDITSFLNENYADDDFSRIDFHEVQRIAGTCVTGCRIADSGPIDSIASYKGFTPRLVKCAKDAWEYSRRGANKRAF